MIHVTKGFACNCHNCFEFDYWCVEIRYGRQRAFLLCSSCANELKRKLAKGDDAE